ncbi:putative nuclease HARBI1 [Chrysoperla carnea]|uniref:putative nuclease HARBI1 n=1 Tax=Chrysoperla carnea TaxID=189513 RepID=UPI001D08E4BB|nr:putative nuclease HARBI1 [Chrysoperla carnea]
MAYAEAAADLLDLEVQLYHMERRAERSVLREIQDPFDLMDSEFKRLYRFTPDLVEELLMDTLGPRLEHQRITGISPKNQILAALRFYATGCFQRPVGEQWGISMSQSSISRSIHRVTDVINDAIFRQWMQFPMTDVARQLAREKFRRAAQPFDGAIGVIDCSHIAILAPREHEEAYVNHHGYHSINVQMICDPDQCILNVNARFPGARHDAHIWSASAARRVMERAYNNGERRTYLLGDSGYPLEPWLLTPLPHAPAGTPRRAYHDALMSSRNVIERTFGTLKTVWRCMHKHRTLQYDPGFAGRIVNACAVLHNMCRAHNLVFNDVEDDGEVAEPPVQQLPLPEEFARPHAVAVRLQNRLIVERWGG